jgi:hypothetical protein
MEFVNNTDANDDSKKNKVNEYIKFIVEKCLDIKEELEMVTGYIIKDNKNMKPLPIDGGQLAELITEYLVTDLFSKVPNWKYNIGPECKYTERYGYSTFKKKRISIFTRHLHIPKFTIKKMERENRTLGRLMKCGYRNFGKDGDGNDINEKYNIKSGRKYGMSSSEFKSLMRKVGDLY